MTLVKSQLNAKFFKKAQAFQDPQGFNESVKFFKKAQDLSEKRTVF